MKSATLLVHTLLWALLVLSATNSEHTFADTSAPQANLAAHKASDEAWAAFIEGLENARAAMIEQKHAAPPNQDSRLAAEGYRYLLGHLERMIELELRMDPRFPEFHASMNMLRKWTIENPDTMYLKAPIDAHGYYSVRAKPEDSREWQNSERGMKKPKAPRLVTFQTISNVVGDTGGLAEMANCTNQTLDFLNSFQLQQEDNGEFEILIGPERPKDFEGNFLHSKKLMPCPGQAQHGDSEAKVAEAKWLAVREIFSDWEFEVPMDMEIKRLDSIGANRPPITQQQANEALTRIGAHLPKQIQFWNLLHVGPLEVYGDTNADGRRAMPVNDLNPPAPPFTAGGVAGAQQIYSGGNFEVAPGKAVVIKVTAPIDAHYMSFQLGTLWGEGPDQQNYVSSLTGHQNPINKNGERYYIIAHEDPSVQGWVDTTGIEKGTMSMRFVFRDQPEQKRLPKIESKVVDLSKVSTLLPNDHPTVSLEQRRKEIAVRQSHIKMRWRGH